MRKPFESREPFAIRLLSGIFVAIPFSLGKVLLAHISKQDEGKRKRLMIGGVLIASLVSFVLIFFCPRIVHFLISSAKWQAIVLCVFYYAAYLVISLPLFSLISFAFQDIKKYPEERKTPDLKAEIMRRNRFQSGNGKIYLGESFLKQKPIFLTDDQRQMHCEVVGSTGTGKTESVLLPMLAHDIKQGKGAIIIDGKSDLELLNRIWYIVTDQGRERDFLFFSLAHPELSNSYNPLYRGNPTELKDKLINSMAWNEEFYRRVAESAALTLFNAISARKKKKIACFRDLHACLTDSMLLTQLADETMDLVFKEDVLKMLEKFSDNQKFLSGLMADLYLTSRSEFSEKLDTINPEIDLLRVYKRKQIVYFSLDLQKYTDTSRRLGRMIIQDIRAVSSYIQSKIPAANRHFFPVFIDDASSFLELNFIDFLNKCRASGFGVTLLHQSLGDLLFRGNPSFQQQVMENTNIKLVLRQDDPLSVERFTKIGGTQKTMISTFQTEEKLSGTGYTGTGSVREGQSFRIDPDLIRSLKLGEAVLILKSPEFLTDYLKLDYLIPGRIIVAPDV